ncbi:MAG: protein-L-isoaspartate O-methyltransferase [Sphingomonadales bacterium]|nr:protein-L-isoaspartate O-methyltransferase [Sphingomonadales bacterium]
MSEQNEARQLMVSGQIMPNKVNDETILNALNAVPRENFLPKAMRGVAYVDDRIKVSDNHDRYVMNPMVLARLLSEADVNPSDLVLVVGGASGYEAAVLGECADAVVCLEEDAALIERSTRDLLSFGADNVAVVEGVLAQGVKGQGPFDVIFINGAVEEVPQVLLDQMAEDGRLVCILNEDGVAHAHIIEGQGSERRFHNFFETEGAVLPGFEVSHGFVFP